MNKDLQTTQGTAATPGTMGSVESNRAIAEVQGQVLMAKQFPRDQIQARANILDACKRMKLAETAVYSYPRGGARVEGPSIRLAETLAQYWGNIDYGIIELEQKVGVGKNPGESVMMSYCRDIQTNTRRQIVFTVPHVRSKRGGNVSLNDPRDVYEVVANMGARRLRACILGIIPGDIIEEAVEAVNRPLAGNSGEPLIDRIKKMVAIFQGVGVSQAMLEKRLGYKVDACLPIDVVNLGKIYKSLQDGMSKVEDWFSSSAKAPAPPPPAEKQKAAPPDQRFTEPDETPQAPAHQGDICVEAQDLGRMLGNSKFHPAIEVLLDNQTYSKEELETLAAGNDANKIMDAIDAISDIGGGSD